jgi:IMP dehydrogenase
MLCKDLKKKYGENIEIMTGNIANPKVYKKLCKHGISWVRAGIGTGSRCTTSNTTGCGYGLATLLDELCEEKNKLISKYPDFEENHTKIIADGGISWYDDICKAIALGADAVMMGGMFVECKEACGPVLYCKSEEDFKMDIGFFEDELYDLSPELRDELTPYRSYAGMSHRSMQKITGGNGSKVSEGIVRPVVVKYPVEHLMENIDAYLRSSMSYCNAFTLKDYVEESQFVIAGGMTSLTLKK